MSQAQRTAHHAVPTCLIIASEPMVPLIGNHRGNLLLNAGSGCTKPVRSNTPVKTWYSTSPFALHRMLAFINERLFRWASGYRGQPLGHLGSCASQITLHALSTETPLRSYEAATATVWAVCVCFPRSEGY